MNTQISFAKFIAPPDSESLTEFRATIDDDGDVMIDVGTRGWLVAWKNIQDPAVLAKIFWSMPVWQFEVVMGMLGEVIRARNAVGAQG
jgi:hypothetical protein